MSQGRRNSHSLASSFESKTPTPIPATTGRPDPHWNGARNSLTYGTCPIEKTHPRMTPSALTLSFLPCNEAPGFGTPSPATAGSSATRPSAKATSITNFPAGTSFLIYTRPVLRARRPTHGSPDFLPPPCGPEIRRLGGDGSRKVSCTRLSRASRTVDARRPPKQYA